MIYLDQPAFNRSRLKAEKLIDSKALEQLIRVQMDAGCSSEFFHLCNIGGWYPKGLANAGYG
jgi:hypothetical protein